MKRWVVSVVAGFVGLLLVAAPTAAAPAHGGDPIITVEATHPGDTSVHYIVKMVWEDDGDPIDGKTLTATPVGPDGVQGTPVTLTGTGGGMYEGSVDMPTPGSWNVTIASADPEGSITRPEVRPEPAATTTEISITTSTTADIDEATEEQAAEDQDRQADGGAGEDDDSGSSAGPIIFVAALVVVVAGGFLGVRTVRKNSATPSDSPPASSD